jgi:iron(III) transport system ATP-binding protein
VSTIEVVGVSKAYAEVGVLDSVDLSVAEGEVMVLLGPSGCGKTTLLQLIAGLDGLDGGSVTVGERLLSGDGTFVPPEKRRVGLVFQNGALFPHLSVAANVGFGLPRGARRTSPRIGELLDLVGLSGLGDRMPDQLSGGQQQRVALARALAPEPDVLLLDEPFSNLDAGLRERLRVEVRRVIGELGITAVFVTHDQAEAFALGDRIAVLHEGVIAQVDSGPDLYRRPADRWVATFVGDAGFVDGVASDGSVETSLGRLDLASPGGDHLEGAVEVLVRPEQVRLAPGEGSGRVVDVVFAGSTASVIVAVDDLRLPAIEVGGPHLSVGDSVAVRLDGPVQAFGA